RAQRELRDVEEIGRVLARLDEAFAEPLARREELDVDAARGRLHVLREDVDDERLLAHHARADVEVLVGRDERAEGGGELPAGRLPERAHEGVEARRELPLTVEELEESAREGLVALGRELLEAIALALGHAALEALDDLDGRGVDGGEFTRVDELGELLP